jgi:uncharacterized protein YjlB
VNRTDLEARLGQDRWTASAWTNGPGERYAAHRHGYDKVLVVAAGAIRFGLPDSGNDVDLAVGDRLDLPAGKAHDAVVGPAGVTCLEAHAPAGSLLSLECRAAGTW